MKKVVRLVSQRLFLPLVIFFLFCHNSAFSYEIPTIRNIPKGGITLRINVTKDMLNYYYRIHFATSASFPIWTVFYRQDVMNHVLAYSLKEMRQPKPNTFYVIDSWQRLREPGEFLLAIMGFNLPIPVQYVVQSLRLSSNTKEDLEDWNTLVVNDSTGIAPRKGTQEFKIRYQLNEDSDMVHKIMDNDNNKEIWKDSIDNVVRGTRGFDWDSQNAKKDHWYRALVEAISTTNKAKQDHDLSDRFKTLK